jgi:hypothetical protein
MDSENTISSEKIASGAAPEAAGDKPSGSPWQWAAVVAALFFLTLCVLAPWDFKLPAPGDDDLDCSWAAVMQWAHVHNVDFGHQLVFTHGPWGHIPQGFVEGTAGGVLAVWLLISAAFFFGIFRIARFMTETHWVAGLFMLAVIFLTGPPINVVDARMFAPCWLLLLIHFYVDDRTWTPEKILLAAAMGVAGYFKFSLFFAAMPVVTVITIDQLWRRRFPSMLVVYIASVIGFWLAAGQPIGSFGPYLHNSWLLAIGYAGGAALDPPEELFDVAQFILIALMFIAALLVAHPWTPRTEPKGMHRTLDEVAGSVKVIRISPLAVRQSVLAIIGGVALLFIDFKSGYIRHDGHELAATTVLAIMSVTFAAALWPRYTSGAMQIFLVLLSLGAIYLSWESQQRFAPAGGPENLLAEVEAIPFRVGAMIDLLHDGPPPFDSGQDLDRVPLPNVKGTVDIYSWGQRELLYQGLNYDPRPVFQSYMTYTQELSDLNAQFLAGSNAPQTILFNAQTVDHHYLSEDDAGSWPQLLTRYNPADASGSHLILLRAADPRSFILVPLSSRQGRMGHWIDVPDSDDPIWVSLQIHPTPLGRLAGLAYKQPILLLGIKTAGKPPQPFRLLPGVAEGGFLLSPEINDRMGFGLLYSSDWKKQLANDQVTQVAVSAAESLSGESVCYDSEYDIQFSALHYPRADLSSLPGIADYLNLRQVFQSIIYIKTAKDHAPDLIEADDGKIVIRSPAGTQILIPLPANAHGFRIGYGLFKSAYRGAQPSKGVDFRIYAVDTEIGKQISADFAWGAHMDPANVHLDRGLHHVTIQFPPGKKVYSLILDTSSDTDQQPADTYWTDLTFK